MNTNIEVKTVLAPKLLGGLVVNILKINMYLLCKVSRVLVLGDILV